MFLWLKELMDFVLYCQDFGASRCSIKLICVEFLAACARRSDLACCDTHAFITIPLGHSAFSHHVEMAAWHVEFAELGCFAFVWTVDR